VSGSPSSSTGCATQLLSASPLAVFDGADFFWSASLSAYDQAGVPILGGIAVSAPEFADTNSVRFYGGALSGLPGLAQYAGQTLHAKKVSVIYYPALPGGTVPYANYIKPVLQHFGVTDVTAVAGNPASSDMSTALAAANQNNPDAIIAIALPNQCPSAIQVHQQQAIQAKLMLVADCSDPHTLGTVGSAANGVIFGYQELAAPSPDSKSNPDIQAFQKAMKKYAPNALLDETAQNGFTQAWDAWQVLNAAPESALNSGSALIAAFKATKNEHNFMGHQYTCNGTQVPGAPAVCDAHSRIYIVENGQLKDVLHNWVNGSPFVTAPASP
jgi:branched-chain amino acid transport system substrate-binding protein